MVFPVIFICIVLFAACDSNAIPDDDFHAADNFNRTIKFSVVHVYSISPVLDSAVAGATINVYNNYEDFMLEYYPDATRQTDSLGQCEINGLDKDKYYIRAKYPAFPDIIDSVSTPAFTTSFVEMLFY